MRRRIDQIGTKVLPRGWKDLIRQILLGFAAYLLYEVVRAVVYGSAYAPGYKPFGDATKIINLERLLHVFVEPSIQAWVAGQPLADGHRRLDLSERALLRDARGAGVHLPAPQRLVLLRAQHVHDRDGDRARRLRAVPDRAAAADAGVGFHRLDLTSSPASTVEKGASSALVNFYAAVPSMHVCFALMVGIPMSRLDATSGGKDRVALYPLLITFVVVATGNHYLTDVFLGALTAGASALIASRLLARARPDAWTFRPARAVQPANA